MSRTELTAGRAHEFPDVRLLVFSVCLSVRLYCERHRKERDLFGRILAVAQCFPIVMLDSFFLKLWYLNTVDHQSNASFSIFSFPGTRSAVI